jgi:CII-binding regulator of phage lambda lysogenization HflD
MNTLLLKTLATFLFMTAVLSLQLPAQESRSNKLGKSDIPGLLGGIPRVPQTTSDAATITFGPNFLMAGGRGMEPLDEHYRDIIKRIQLAQKDLQDDTSAWAKQDSADKGNYQKAYDKTFNASPLIAGMGGTDKIRSMTPEQQRAAAMRATPGAIQAGMDSRSPGMQAMMNKAMSDPEYMKRLQHMSPQEQQAEMQKYMANDPGQTLDQYQKNQQRKQEEQQTSNKVQAAKELHDKFAKLLNSLQAAEDEFKKGKDAIASAVPPITHQQIDQAIAQKLSKALTVDMGELGRDIDPKVEKQIKVEGATNHHNRAAWDMGERGKLFVKYRAQCNDLASAYLALLQNHRPEIDAISASADIAMIPYRIEVGAASFEAELLKDAESLANFSREATLDAANYEWDYQKETAPKPKSQPRTGPTKSKK